MTALKDYIRLETVGIWRATAKAQRREVGVSFGNATLVISDTAGRPLTHWSLAAVTRLNPGSRPALFGPGDSASKTGTDIETETLEIEDDVMVDAIGQVQRGIARARPRPGRLRWAILGVTTATLAWLGVFWLPRAVVDHAVAVVPQVTRAALGKALLGHVAQLSGAPCSDPFGTVALRRLNARLAPGETLHVFPSGVATTAALPGGHILLGRAVLEDHDDPAVLYGYLTAEMARARLDDPLRHLLDQTGTRATIGLLTTGQIADDLLRRYTEALLTAPRAPLSTEATIAAFRDRQVSTSPYAFALDITGETTLSLIEADPIAPDTAVSYLSDGEWLSLQSMCDG